MCDFSVMTVTEDYMDVFTSIEDHMNTFTHGLADCYWQQYYIRWDLAIKILT